MDSKFSEQEAFLALCLAVASQDNELNEDEREPLVSGMKKAGLLECEYDLREIFHSTVKKISYVFQDGKAFDFGDKNLDIFADKIKQALSKEKLELLFETAVDIAIADGVLEIETELDFLKKIHDLFKIEKNFEKIIQERSGV